MVILSRVDACAPPYPTMYTGSGDVKQKRRARRPEGEEWSEAGIRNLRQQVKYALRFFVVETALHQNPKQLSLSPPSRTAASASSQAGQSNKTKREYLLFLLTHHPPTRYAVAAGLTAEEVRKDLGFGVHPLRLQKTAVPLRLLS